MADYKESQISGKKYRRCNSIRINNHIAPHTPSVYFDEQDVVYVEDEDPIVMPGGMFGTQFNPANVIEILNTETLEPTGPLFMKVNCMSYFLVSILLLQKNEITNFRQHNHDNASIWRYFVISGRY